MFRLYRVYIAYVVFQMCKCYVSCVAYVMIYKLHKIMLMLKIIICIQVLKFKHGGNIKTNLINKTCDLKWYK
jgi:hypothetical protein